MAKVIIFNGTKWIRNITGSATINLNALADSSGLVKTEAPTILQIPLSFGSGTTLLQEGYMDVSIDISFSNSVDSIVQKTPLAISLDIGFGVFSEGATLYQENNLTVAVPLVIQAGLIEGAVQLYQSSDLAMNIGFDYADIVVNNIHNYQAVLLLGNNELNVLQDLAGQTVSAIGTVTYVAFGKEGSGSIHVSDNSYIHIEQNNKLALSSLNASISMWVNVLANNGEILYDQHSLLGNISPAETLSANKWLITASTNWNFYIGNYSTTTPILQSTTPVKYGEWTHIAVNIKDGTKTLYINGVAQSSITTVHALDDNTAQSIYVGGANSRYANAYFDSIDIQQRARFGTSISVPNYTIAPYIQNFTEGQSIISGQSGTINLPIGTVADSGLTATTTFLSTGGISGLSIVDDNIVGSFGVTAPGTISTFPTTYVQNTAYNITLISDANYSVSVVKGLLPPGLILFKRVLSGTVKIFATGVLPYVNSVTIRIMDNVTGASTDQTISFTIS